MNATTLFRETLLRAADQAAFPTEPMVDPETGDAFLDPQATADTATLFDLFGVTGLKADDPDLDKILNTVCTLTAEVAAHVESLNRVAGDASALAGADDWHPDYRAYVQALWHGDRAAIARLAEVLGLSHGISNGSLPLQDGPLA
ncbi:MAG: hypothetical protein LH479_03760 [Polaromonas sp.]|nr:hypothetical protein [Polaromonas sp.]